MYFYKLVVTGNKHSLKIPIKLRLLHTDLDQSFEYQSYQVFLLQFSHSPLVYYSIETMYM